MKYESMGGDVNAITAEGDRISCLCLSDKILAIGTERGNVHVLDYEGNQARNQGFPCLPNQGGNQPGGSVHP